MRIIHSRDVKPIEPAPTLKARLETISEEQLRLWVQQISRPRHFVSEGRQNQLTADWLVETLASFGFRPQRQGPFSNIIALPPECPDEVMLVGAHFDSVPGSPGADDNASAVATMLGCAAVCAAEPRPPVVVAAFNREEEGFLGSRDFVESHLPNASFRIRCAHILEMVGYASSAPGSQRLPTGLPIQLSDVGNFLGLLANQQSAEFMDGILGRAAASGNDLPVIGLQVIPGAERLFPVLARSDHVPFWSRQIAAVMWTDTAEFRNPNYHQPTDAPETLDYGFLTRVTQLLAASVLGKEFT
ncbi:MAG TPA: M28 family peptidase [Verrucomicrobiae bacterium]|nr:M28 family peptidase [Verrucomicrobiae bacterium]